MQAVPAQSTESWPRGEPPPLARPGLPPGALHAVLAVAGGTSARLHSQCAALLGRALTAITRCGAWSQLTLRLLRRGRMLATGPRASRAAYRTSGGAP